MLEYLNENYECGLTEIVRHLTGVTIPPAELRHGAERLVDPDDGDLAGYLRDTNWPGATSCAMSPVAMVAMLWLKG